MQYAAEHCQVQSTHGITDKDEARCQGHKHVRLKMRKFWKLNSPAAAWETQKDNYF